MNQDQFVSTYYQRVRRGIFFYWKVFQRKLKYRLFTIPPNPPSDQWPTVLRPVEALSTLLDYYEISKISPSFI